MPYGRGYSMSAGSIVGSNENGIGSIAYLDNTNTSGNRFGFQATLQLVSVPAFFPTPTNVIVTVPTQELQFKALEGTLEFFSNSNSVSQVIRIHGDKQP